MFINDNFDIVLKSTGNEIKVRNKQTNETRVITLGASNFEELRNFYNDVYKVRPDLRPTSINTDILLKLFGIAVDEVAKCSPSASPEEVLTEGIKALMRFFTEFQFEPNFRFINSLSLALTKSQEKAKDYVEHYFELIDSPFVKEVREKMKSPEFASALTRLSVTAPTKTINSRFKLYYGSQGTGKTTIAMDETEGRCMVCNSSMLPSDLMEDFTFESGKATFKPSALWRSMVEGKPIVLDEINLLPFDSLRFLQTILDGKKQFLYKGNEVEIADGFKIIGTMNLTVNGMTYGLPEPLVDRAESMEKFTLTANDLIKAII